MKKLIIAMVLAGIVQGAFALGVGKAGVSHASAADTTMQKVDATQ